MPFAQVPDFMIFRDFREVLHHGVTQNFDLFGDVFQQHRCRRRQNRLNVDAPDRPDRLGKFWRIGNKMQPPLIDKLLRRARRQIGGSLASHDIVAGKRAERHDQPGLAQLRQA